MVCVETTWYNEQVPGYEEMKKILKNVPGDLRGSSDEGDGRDRVSATGSPLARANLAARASYFGT